ncbi:MAG TPA: RNA ligase partner protein [Aquifex aeolicus]|uniref:RNA-free ribonuclease P n=1 Tax=Aquifex aeolicus TaxID=63363 RepID=A0A9D0YQ45_AQUAO|nr:RNA ligase partner protein [Aquifex sp.]HIP98090.1 RNA ligase partner protein [Aquifex aeolicus]HIQ26684.1 RNA ligase partner protein [Aquifex aeolicus]
MYRQPLTFVLDTSVFTNPQLYKKFAENILDAMEDLLYLIEHSRAEFYMPVSVYEELQKMVKLEKLIPKFELVIRLRNPRRYNLLIPADFLYEFISDLRGRVNKGLRIAEEHVRDAQNKQKEALGEVIRSLREKYREALRQGILDSKEDVEVLLLAYELDAILVSADEGLRNWAKKLGIKLISPDYFKELLEELAQKVKFN